MRMEKERGGTEDLRKRRNPACQLKKTNMVLAHENQKKTKLDN